MKRFSIKGQRFREFIDRSLAPFNKAPQEHVDAVCDRVLQRLREEPESELDEIADERHFASPRAQRFRSAFVFAATAILVVAVLQAAAIRKFVFGDAAPAIAEIARLEIGQTVGTSANSGSMFTLADGSRIEMRANSKLSLERAVDGFRIRLARGGVIVNAAKQRQGHLYVRTKDVTVSVVGTVFLVNAEEEGSRVSVIEGEVRVQQGGMEKSLRPGEQVTTNPTMKPLSVTEEIAWSLQAPLHLALLQQSTVTPTQPREAFDVISIRRSTVPAGAAPRGQGGGGRMRNQRGGEACSNAGEPVIDPARFDAANVTVFQLTVWAYGLDCMLFRGSDYLFGGPDWIRKDGYDVQAVIPAGTPSYTNNQLSQDQAPRLKAMLRTMMTERFNLEVRREIREMPVYVLSVAEGGPRYTAVMPPQPPPPIVNGIPMPSRRERQPGTVMPEFSKWEEGDTRNFSGAGNQEIHGRKRTITDLVRLLSFFMGRPVLDRTNLTGYFNYFLEFAAVECATCPFAAPGPDARREPGADTPPTTPIFDLFKKVGLELKPTNERIEVVVIDRAERPTEN